VVHLGTAVLRLNALIPPPQALDFSSYYAGAWAIRRVVSPYPWSAELLDFLAATRQLPFTPPLHNSPPLWSWLMQPFTLLPFPAAATLWLATLLALVVVCHLLLMRLAGYRRWKPILLAFPLTLTFGPLFLNLTLGQNGILLLFSALLFGTVLNRPEPQFSVSNLLLWLIAVAAKLFPVFWAGSYLFVRRRRDLLITMLFLGLAWGVVFLAKPAINADYWLDFLPDQADRFARSASVDDQSLPSYLKRIGREGTYSFPGLSVQERIEVTWRFPWNFAAERIQITAWMLIALIGLGIFYLFRRRVERQPEAVLYTLVLYSLLLLPHMERYNHILALPALCWLWSRSRRSRILVVTAYGFFALSRLNHLLAMVPAPAGPFLTGFGLFGVLLLLGGLLATVR